MNSLKLPAHSSQNSNSPPDQLAGERVSGASRCSNKFFHPRSRYASWLKVEWNSLRWKNFLGVSELSYRESYRKSDISFVKTLYRRCIGKFSIYRNVRFGSSSFFVPQWFKNFIIIRSKLKKSIENRSRLAQLLDAKFIWSTEARVNSFHRAIKFFYSRIRWYSNDSYD